MANKNKVKIRTATLKDLNSLLAIRNSLNYHNVPQSYVARHKFKIDEKRLLKIAILDYQDAIKSADKKIFLAQQNEKVIGFIYGLIKRFYGEQVGTINELAILKSCAGKGVEKALFERLIRWFKRKKCKAITVELNVENRPGLRLYRSLGFISWENILMFILKNERRENKQN